MFYWRPPNAFFPRFIKERIDALPLAASADFPPRPETASPTTGREPRQPCNKAARRFHGADGRMVGADLVDTRRVEFGGFEFGRVEFGLFEFGRVEFGRVEFARAALPSRASW